MNVTGSIGMNNSKSAGMNQPKIIQPIWTRPPQDVQRLAAHSVQFPFHLFPRIHGIEKKLDPEKPAIKTMSHRILYWNKNDASWPGISKKHQIASTRLPQRNKLRPSPKPAAVFRRRPPIGHKNE
ncbi:MAG TPA: hypothetical protein VFB72_15980 [Verrucomicrobiae bacterium]|nr:hypothetical protein [Verrucomicrobiae bacterium]